MTEHGVDGLRQPPVAGIARDGDSVVVSLSGELDLYNAHEVRQALLDECTREPSRLVVDLGDVTFIDSTALGVLVEARAKMPNRRAFMVAVPSGATRRAFEIAGLDRHFALHDTVEEALRATL